MPKFTVTEDSPGFKALFDDLRGQSERIKDLFLDTCLFDIAPAPLFCPKTGKMYDESSIARLLKEYDGYRAFLQLASADKSKINLALQNPDDDDLTENDRAVYPLLKKWVELFPSHRFDQINQMEGLTELDRMERLTRLRDQHQYTLRELGGKLSEAVEIGLSHEVKALITKRKQKKGDQEEIEGILLSLTDKAKEDIKAQLQAIMWSQEGYGWTQLLEDEAVLDSLVSLGLSHLYEIEKMPYFNRKKATEPLGEFLHKQIDLLTDKQLAIYSNYEGRLQTEFDKKGVVCTPETREVLQSHEVKDPATRFTIDSQSLVDATMYQMILIGGVCYADGGIEHIDDDLKTFIESQIKEDAAYLDKVKEACLTYMSGLDTFQMDEALMASLAEFGIKPKTMTAERDGISIVVQADKDRFFQAAQASTDKTDDTPSDEPDRESDLGKKR